ncbi:hypothetical protein AAHE18_13G157300 [Arachis hypogaea]
MVMSTMEVPKGKEVVLTERWSLSMSLRMCINTLASTSDSTTYSVLLRLRTGFHPLNLTKFLTHLPLRTPQISQHTQQTPRFSFCFQFLEPSLALVAASHP